jgi:ribonuclease BN (tRNA processing enzyme)
MAFVLPATREARALQPWFYSVYKEHVRLHFLGSGTPNGLAGLHQACILVETSSHKLLLDCGMTALASLGRAGVDPSVIDAVIVSHLHGDHFGGLAPLLLDAALRGRDRPLTIAGPSTTRERVEAALAVFGWTSSASDAASYVTLAPGKTTRLAGCQVTALEVPHNPATRPTGIRLEVDGRTLGYSGDAGWSRALVDLARDADLFICAVWGWDSFDPTFVDLSTLARERAQLRCRRLMLTHLGPEVLDRIAEMPFEVAADGLIVEL